MWVILVTDRLDPNFAFLNHGLNLDSGMSIEGQTHLSGLTEDALRAKPKPDLDI